MCEITSFFRGLSFIWALCDKSFNDVIKLDLSAYCLSNAKVWVSSEVFSLAANQSQLLGSSHCYQKSAASFNNCPYFVSVDDPQNLYSDLLPAHQKVGRFYKST